VAQDLRVALGWYAAAARQGDEVAREQARLLADRIARDRDT
jgi:TPR repeat protein